MTVTVEQFRAAFPKPFQDVFLYPDAEVTFWLNLGGLTQDQLVWGELYDYGLQLFTAHNLALGAMAGAANGGVVGSVVGPVTSASVDKVSYSRDPGKAMDPAAGHWNLTTWGLQYRRLQMMLGAKPIQVGVSLLDTNAPNGAWPGVIFPTTTP